MRFKGGGGASAPTHAHDGLLGLSRYGRLET